MELLAVGPNPRWQDGGWPPSCKISNGRVSGTGRPIDFVFDRRVVFSGTADRMALFPFSPNPRWHKNVHISGMSCAIHFHELRSSLED